MSTTSGNNNGSFTATATANTTTTGRTASITVTGSSLTQIITVSQSGTTPTLSVNPTTLTYSAAGSTQTISVTSNITWATSDDAAWLTLSTISGSNNGSFTATASANGSTFIRSATITITGGALSRIINITQNGLISSLIVNPISIDFEMAGNSKTLTVSSNISWAAYASEPWLTITNGSATGNGVFSAAASLFTGMGSRTAMITVSGGGLNTIIYVNQKQTQLDFNVPEINFGVTGGSTVLSVAGNVNWIVTTDAPWLSFSTSTGIPNTSLTVFSTQNPDSISRIAMITLSGGGLSKTYLVSQNSFKQLEISRDTMNVTNSIIKHVFSITSNINWSITKQVNWLSINKASGSGSASVDIISRTNVANSPRNATLTISGGGIVRTIYLYQGATIINNMEEDNISNPLQIYPNPSCGQTIAFNKIINYKLFDGKGILIISHKNSYNMTVDQLNSGFYLIITDKNEVRKLIIY